MPVYRTVSGEKFTLALLSPQEEEEFWADPRRREGTVQEYEAESVAEQAAEDERYRQEVGGTDPEEWVGTDQDDVNPHTAAEVDHMLRQEDVDYTEEDVRRTFDSHEGSIEWEGSDDPDDSEGYRGTR